MDKYDIVNKIENFAPLDTQEPWDCSGWIVETKNKVITKVMLALTINEKVYYQAKEKNCDMIISHHPLFFVPTEFKDIDIYCAHTNMDLAGGGTTDTLVNSLGFSDSVSDGFVRYIDADITFNELNKRLRQISPNLRYTNYKEKFHKLAFCAGSGAEFIQEAFLNGADCYITGDLKFHTVVDSQITVFDIGHFESEIMVLKVFEKLLDGMVEHIFAKESSPFIY